jgi:SAM-dependent methyltransferase
MSAAGRMIPGVSEEILEKEHVARYRFACRFVRGRDVLDAACGVGYSAPMFLEAGARSYFGFDINAEAVESATKKYRTNDAISFVVDDACKFRHVPERAFDLAVSFETIEHVPSAEAFLANVRRALRPGGIFIVSTPYRLRYSPGNKLSSKPWNPYHVREWNGGEFLDLLKPWFRVTQVLGQEPIPRWKAHLIALAATNPSLKGVITALRPARRSESPTSGSSSSAGDAALELRSITPWYVPLYTVCIAEARS